MGLSAVQRSIRLYLTQNGHHLHGRRRVERGPGPTRVADDRSGIFQEVTLIVLVSTLYSWSQ